MSIVTSLTAIAPFSSPLLSYHIQDTQPFGLVQLSELYPENQGFLFNLQVDNTAKTLILQNMAAMQYFKEFDMSFRQLVEAQGFRYEEFLVLTTDGYYLTM